MLAMETEPRGVRLLPCLYAGCKLAKNVDTNSFFQEVLFRREVRGTQSSVYTDSTHTTYHGLMLAGVKAGPAHDLLSAFSSQGT